MTLTGRRGLVWVGMILAGLVLGGYVCAVWPDTTTPAAKSQPVRATASVDSELAGGGGVAGAFYYGEYFVYELGPTPFLDAVIAVPPALEAG